MEFRECLCQIRKSKGISQEKLAENVGVSRQAVSKWETGEAQPDLTKVIALADALEVSIDELCGRKVEKTSENVTEQVQSSQKISGKSKILSFIVAFCIGILAVVLLAKITTAPIPDEIYIESMGFSISDEGLHCEIIPSVCDDAYEYQICFTGNLVSGRKTFDLDYENGLCSQTVSLREDDNYTVTLIVGNGLQEKEILLGKNLQFTHSIGRVVWSPY